MSRAASTATGLRVAVAAGHPLAVAAAEDVARQGGNAVDAAVAAHAVCAVVMPDACGLGGDALALVRHPGGEIVAVTGAGVTAAAAGTRVATDGGGSVTVPGAVAAWDTMSRRFGRLPSAAVLAPAIRLAEEGFAPSTSLVAAVAAQRPRLLRGGAGDWPVLHAAAGRPVRQPELARTLGDVASSGPDAFYRGRVAAALVEAVRRDGGCLTTTDLAAHTTLVGPPVAVSWAGGTAFVQPPPSQGVLLAAALRWLAGREVPADRRDHVAVELTEAAFGLRDRCLADGERLLDVPLEVDAERAARRGGPRAYLHTTGVATADTDGLVVSSLLSVFDDFGAGTFVPECGFVLNNRAAGFTTAPNDAGPSKRPVHTLAPMIVHSGVTATALATPGADGQVQTLLQVLLRVREGADLADAVAAPRWRSESGRLLVERAHPAQAVLAGRGHDVVPLADGDDRFGAVVAATAGAGAAPRAVGDWRRGVASGGS